VNGFTLQADLLQEAIFWGTSASVWLAPRNHAGTAAAADGRELDGGTAAAATGPPSGRSPPWQSEGVPPISDLPAGRRQPAVRPPRETSRRDGTARPASVLATDSQAPLERAHGPGPRARAFGKEDVGAGFVRQPETQLRDVARIAPPSPERQRIEEECREGRGRRRLEEGVARREREDAIAQSAAKRREQRERVDGPWFATSTKGPDRPDVPCRGPEAMADPQVAPDERPPEDVQAGLDQSALAAQAAHPLRLRETEVPRRLQPPLLQGSSPRGHGPVMIRAG
jgi:hypothetical protein